MVKTFLITMSLILVMVANAISKDQNVVSRMRQHKVDHVDKGVRQHGKKRRYGIWLEKRPYIRIENNNTIIINNTNKEGR